MKYVLIILIRYEKYWCARFRRGNSSKILFLRNLHEKPYEN